MSVLVINVKMKLLSCVVTLVALALVDAELCEVPCTREYTPVCGTDGEKFKIFSNACVMKNEHCSDGRNWFKTRMSECGSTVEFEEDIECGKPCTKEYRPVCGTDGEHFKVFPNQCVMGNQHCKDGIKWIQTRMAECSSEIEYSSQCEVPCTKELRPVCGTNGEHFKIFSNPCVMRNQHCKDGLKWIQTRMAECSSEIEYLSQCGVPCTRELRPVCGTNGEYYKIFSNPCVMGNQHCKDGRNWFETRMADCGNVDEEYSADKCSPQMCPAIFAPVCACDGENYKLFPNKCMMERARCVERKNWTASTLDKCPMP